MVECLSRGQNAQRLTLHTLGGMEGTLTPGHTTRGKPREVRSWRHGWGPQAHTPPLSSWLTQEGLDPCKICRAARVLESDVGLVIEDTHLQRTARIQVLRPGHPGEAVCGREVSLEHSTPTTPAGPWDSPNNIFLHEAQLLRTEGAEVGRMEVGQHVQGDLVQLAPSHQIAGHQGSHLWEEPCEVPWGRKRRIPSGLQNLTPYALSRPAQHHTLCSPLGLHNLHHMLPL